MGEAIDSLVLGIGVNVSPAAVPPPELLTFPATCLEAAAGRTVDRILLLHDILSALFEWRPLLRTSVFFDAWQERLAFRGERVEVPGEGGTLRVGTLEGLMPDGSLRLRSATGDVLTVQYGDVHLRPVV
jgi:biotin-(acetyl-CoA carboxylase) ligase